MDKLERTLRSRADILAIDSHKRYLDNGFQRKGTKRLCIGSVHGSFSIELINVLSWCTVIKAAVDVPDERPVASCLPRGRSDNRTI
jgi:hypothetical protein